MNKDVIIKIKENSYKVSFPTVGQFLDIEAKKAQLSKGFYGDMMSTATYDSLFALDIIDACAHFEVLMPAQFTKDLPTANKTIEELGILDMIELRDVYREQLLPFIKQWREVINKLYLPKETKDGE